MSFKKGELLLASAAALVAAEFGLFGKVLENLAPPVVNVDIKVGIASLVSLAVLLLITLLARRVGRRADLWFALAALAFLIAAAGFYLAYEEAQGEYVYRYPPTEDAHYSADRYIRGELHEDGVKRLAGQSISAAVADLGGVDFVVGQQLLWTERSQRQVELKLVTLYLLFVAALGASLYCLIVRLIR